MREIIRLLTLEERTHFVIIQRPKNGAVWLILRKDIIKQGIFVKKIIQ